MRKAISVGTGVLILAGLLGSPVQAGETEQVTGGVKKPKHTQATQPSAAGSQNPPAAVTSRGASGRGIQKMMEKRTQGFAKEWAGDAKSKIKPMLQELPLSPVFITQLIMNAALPSVGDVLAKTMNQGQLGGVFEGGTMGAMSTTMAGGGGG
ncbi:MAG: hypothetical protein HYY13_12160, partial [Nitrospirae bacterium]|nr:hypothetical protein [Nitrospirota bacterium]